MSSSSQSTTQKKSGVSKRGRRSLGASDERHAFPLERALRVYTAIRGDGPPPTAELLVQLNGLVSKKLLSRLSRAEQLDAPRLRCAAPHGLVAGVADDVGIELDRAYFGA